MGLGEFRGKGRSATHYDRVTDPEQLVEASVQRMQLATENLAVGVYSPWNLSPRRQEFGTTCFFQGAIELAIESGRKVSERQIEMAARAMGLLNDGGTITSSDKYKSMQDFVRKHTGVSMHPNKPSMPEGQPQDIDRRLIKCVIEDGNLANLLYPLNQVDQSGIWNGRGEWITVFSIEKTPQDLIWKMNFSPTGVIQTLNSREMAKRLYGIKGGRPEIWTIEVQTSYPETNQVSSPMFRPKK